MAVRNTDTCQENGGVEVGNKYRDQRINTE